MPNNQAPVEVIQGDRDAAGDMWLSLFPHRGGEVAVMREGNGDDGAIVQAFAKHRLAYQSEAPAGSAVDVERVRLLLSDMLFKFDPSCGGTDCDSTARMIAPLLVAAFAPSLPLADREAIARAAASVERDIGAHGWGVLPDKLQAHLPDCWCKEYWLNAADAILALSGSLPPSPVGEGSK